jgi:hypothetical protein
MIPERGGYTMANSSPLIVARLAWCRIQRKQATTREEAERLRAEEEGLIDAMLERNRLERYEQAQQFRREHYELGLQDGQALMGLQRWSDICHSIAID